MANLKWHADELNRISSDIKRRGHSHGAERARSSDDRAQPEVKKRSRPNPLLRKLRNAHRHREIEIAAEPYDTSNVIPVAWGPAAPQAEPSIEPQWQKRGMMLALVPLSIVGMAALFVLGFIGSREIVTYLVGRDYVPAALTAAPPDITAGPQTAIGERSEANLRQTDSRAAASADVSPGDGKAPGAPAAAVAEETKIPVSEPETVAAAAPSVAIETEAPAAPVEPIANEAEIAIAEPQAEDVIAEAPVVPEVEDPVAEAPVAVPVEVTEPDDLGVADGRLIMRAIVESVFAERAANTAATTPPSVAAVDEAPVQPQAAVQPIPEDPPTQVQATAIQPEPEEQQALVEQQRVAAIDIVAAPETAIAAGTAATPEIATETAMTPKITEAAAPEPAIAAETVVTPQITETAALDTAAVPETITTPETTAVPASHLIGQGQSLMASGDIVKARELFLQGLESGSPEAALALGRSYDPKYLDRMPTPNAKPNAAAARKWYEEWYRRSIEQGSISPNVRLERLLQAINVD